MSLKTYDIIELLEEITKKDKEKIKKLQNGTAATFCPSCNRNTSTGFYPFWHVYRRTLCTECGKEYYVFLEKIGAVDK